MNDRSDNRSANSGGTLLGRMQRLANLGDRWFVAVGRTLNLVGAWAQREVDVTADGAASALAESVASTGGAPALCGCNGSCSEPPRTAAESYHRGSESPDSEAPTSGLDLLSATPISGDAARSRDPSGAGAPGERTRAAPGACQNPPGVRPLAQALGRVVAEHSEQGYLRLSEDDRLWPLLDLMHTLGRPPSLPPPACEPSLDAELPHARPGEGGDD